LRAFTNSLVTAAPCRVKFFSAEFIMPDGLILNVFLIITCGIFSEGWDRIEMEEINRRRRGTKYCYMGLIDK
jgi:hypothetical protein